jgi:hypothetical protein
MPYEIIIYNIPSQRYCVSKRAYLDHFIRSVRNCYINSRGPKNDRLCYCYRGLQIHRGLSTGSIDILHANKSDLIRNTSHDGRPVQEKQVNFAPRYSEVLAALLQKRTRRITFLTRNFPFRQLVNIKTQTVRIFTPHAIFISIHPGWSKFEIVFMANKDSKFSILLH